MKNKLSAWCLLLVMALTSATMQAQSNHNLETAKQLDIFNSLYRDLDLNYVDTIDAKKNIENAILFMLDQLDPYTEYFPANRNEEIKQMTTGKYAGVGAIIAPRKDLRRCIISTPYEGMPAANVGLRRGDVILSIGAWHVVRHPHSSPRHQQGTHLQSDASGHRPAQHHVCHHHLR